MKRINKWLLSGLLAQGVLAGGVHAQSIDIEKDTSLRLVPNDADFYAASFDQAAQWRALAEGPVVQKLLNLPVVVENLNEFYAQWGDRSGPLSQARMIFENPNAQDALNFAKELFAKETFAFADGNLGDLIANSNALVLELQTLAAKLDGDEEAIASTGAAMISSRIKDMKIPLVVLGGRCDDSYMAITKVDQLEALLSFAFQINPDLDKFRRRLRRVDDDRGSRLTFQLNSDMIPWDDIPIEDDIGEEALEEIRTALEGKSVALTVGSLDNYFIVALSAKSSDVLEMGKEAGLAKHPDLKPAMDASDKGLSQLVYISDSYASSVFESNFKNVLSNNARVYRAALEVDVLDSPEKTQFADEVQVELQRFDDALWSMVPEQKGSTLFGYLTPTGFESYNYVRTKNDLLDGSKPLTGLKHLGKDALVAAVTRLQHRPDHFALLRDAIVTARKLFDRSIELKIFDEDEMEDANKIKAVVDKLWPTLERLNGVIENQIIPSLDGEHGLVIHSGNLKSTQWLPDFPAASEPIPVLEVAAFSKTKDSTAYRDGLGELLEVADEFVSAIKTIDEEAVADDFRIPRPVEETSALGQKYTFPIPEECPVPADLIPQFLFTDGYAFAGYSDTQIESLVQETSAESLFANVDVKGALASASFVDIGQLLKAFVPAIRYAVQEQVEDLDASLLEGNDPITQSYTLTVNDLLSIYDVLTTIGRYKTTVEVDAKGQTVSRSVYTRSTP